MAACITCGLEWTMTDNNISMTPEAMAAAAKAGCPHAAAAKAQVEASTESQPNPFRAGSNGGECPVNKGMSGKVMQALTSANSASGAPGGCPVVAAGSDNLKKKPSSTGPVYNVYSQEIDPTNMMPPANQEPAPGQQVPLSKERVVSNIPKGGTEGTWLYPSPQMFWNSLVRKGKTDGVQENDIDVVVAIHNEMNERTWQQVVHWESKYKDEQTESQPSLRRFMGNPYKLSPKAWLKSKLGYGFPFDRHDWFVDRGDKQVHYVIDYYYNPNGPATHESVLHSQGKEVPNAPQYTGNIYVDVRPAVESFGTFVDRLLNFPRRALASSKNPKFFADGIDPSKTPKEFKEALHSSETLEPAPKDATPAGAIPKAVMEKRMDDITQNCEKLRVRLAESKDDDEKRSLQVALNYCMGKILCPTEANTFFETLSMNQKNGTEGQAGGVEEKAFESMTKCVMKELQVTLMK